MKLVYKSIAFLHEILHTERNLKELMRVKVITMILATNKYNFLCLLYTQI